MTKRSSSQQICRRSLVGDWVSKTERRTRRKTGIGEDRCRSNMRAKVKLSYSELRSLCYQLAAEDAGQPSYRNAARGQLDQRLKAALERLRAILQAMTPAVRQDRLASLAADVRAALLGFMEGRSTERPTNSSKIELESNDNSHRIVKAVERKAVLPGSGLAGVHKGQRGLYRAKISIDGVILYSRYASLAVAASYQSTLVQFRHNVAARLLLLSEGEETGLEMGDSCPEKVFTLPMQPELLRGAFLAALAEGAVGAAFAEAGVRMYLSLHVAKWLGSVHVTSPVVSAVEVLSLREHLLSARMLGWEAFRQAWVDLLQIQKTNHRCRRWAASAVRDSVEDRVERVFQRNSAIGERQKQPCKSKSPRTLATKCGSTRKTAVVCRKSLRLGRLERRFGHSVRITQRILAWMCRTTRHRPRVTGFSASSAAR